MPKKIKLTKKKASWYEERNKKVVKGTTLNYNASIQAKMKTQLDKLVTQMVNETEKEINKLFNADNVTMTFDADISSSARIILNALMRKYNKLFKDRGLSISKSMVNNTEKVASSNVFSSLEQLSGGLKIKTSDISSQTKSILKASTTESANLIKSIQSKYLDDIAGETYRSITTGQGLKDLIPYLRDQRGATKRRAKNIALDQTRKAYSSVTRSKMEEAGVKKFIWNHSFSSAEPRKEHLAHNGKIYSFDDLPQYKGKDDMPSWLPFCRCTMTPVIEFEED
jgi:SPP1 gp7 family putative phage head morphogenesis protein